MDEMLEFDIGDFDTLLIVLFMFMTTFLGSYLYLEFKGLGSLRHYWNRPVWCCSEGGTSLSSWRRLTGVAKRSILL